MPQSTSPQIRISSWEDIPPEFDPIFFHQDKPLPPLPNDWNQSAEEQHIHRKPAKKRSGCFLSKMKRSKSDCTHSPNQKDKRSVSTTPKLTLSVPQQLARTVPSSPLLWVPDEQVWLVRDPPMFQERSYWQREDDGRQQSIPSVSQRTTPVFTITDDEGDISPPPSYSSGDYWGSELRRSSGGSQWGAVANRLSRPASTGH
ncbi:MAG: hypothetical protein M1830_008230 [Pleopsidium flavum]|nr:MAG: hypothetical protein M1830_008230 [Pleopsidium flavum]